MLGYLYGRRFRFEPKLLPYKNNNILKPSHSSYLTAYEEGRDRVPKRWHIPTYRIFSNLIRTSFCRFPKRKKCQFAVPVRTFPSTAPCLQGRLNNIGCYQCSNRYPTNTPCVKWPFNCQRYKRTTADGSDWVTDSDSVMSDDDESDA